MAYLQVFDGTRYRTILTAPGEMSFPQPGLLGTAAWHVDAAKLTDDGNGLADLSGNGRHALFGAGAAAPLVLDHQGEDYARLPAVSGNRIDISAGTYVLQNRLEVTLRARVDEAALAGQQRSLFISGDYGGTFTGHCLTVTLYGDGRVRGSNRMPSPDLTFSNVWTDYDSFQFDKEWHRIIQDGLSFWYEASDDGVTWTQHGATKTFAAGHEQVSAGGLARVGYSDGITGTPCDMSVYSAQFTGDVSGTVFSFDVSDAHTNYTKITNTGSLGKDWTINRAASGYKTAVVNRPLVLFGGSQSAAVSAFQTASDFTALAAYRTFGTQSPGHGRILRKTAGSGGGWMFYQSNGGSATTGYLYIAGVGTSRSIAATTEGQHVLGMRYDGARFETFADGAMVDGIARTGDASDAANPLLISETDDAEFIAAAVFDRALTDEEVARATEELLSGAARSVDDVLPRSVGDLMQSPVPRTDWDDDWVPLTLINGWREYGGSPYHGRARIRLLPGGMVTMEGLVTGGTAKSAICYLPTRYHPEYRVLTAGYTAINTQRLQINEDGLVYYPYSTSTSWHSIHASWYAGSGRDV